jgi:hypothetical protein
MVVVVLELLGILSLVAAMVFGLACMGAAFALSRSVKGDDK